MERRGEERRVQYGLVRSVQEWESQEENGLVWKSRKGAVRFVPVETGMVQFGEVR